MLKGVIGVTRRKFSVVSSICPVGMSSCASPPPIITIDRYVQSPCNMSTPAQGSFASLDRAVCIQPGQMELRRKYGKSGDTSAQRESPLNHQHTYSHWSQAYSQRSLHNTSSLHHFVIHQSRVQRSEAGIPAVCSSWKVKGSTLRELLLVEHNGAGPPRLAQEEAL